MKCRVLSMILSITMSTSMLTEMEMPVMAQEAQEIAVEETSSAEFRNHCRQYGLGTNVDQTKKIYDTVQLKKFIRRFYT